VDNILVVGAQDQKLTGFLKKMGYGLVEFDGSMPLPDLLSRHMLDLVLLDTRIELDSCELLNFLRAQECTRQVPIVCMTDRPRVKQNIKELGLDRLELFDYNYQIGRVVSAIATQLRMTKNAGKDERTASIVEMNAALRDLTDHFKKELKEARSIQEGLLPKTLPSGDGFEMSVLYEPLEELGGDWYFVSQDTDGVISIQIADVTGHGLGAAFIGSMTKLALTAVGSQQPDLLLTRMNALMAPQLPPGRFVTMGSYQYVPARGELHYARAGHPPALIVRAADGSVEEVRGEGFPVGFFDDSEYKGGVTSLAKDDVFLAITDGFSEAQNRALETYGMERLAASIKSLPVGSATEDIKLKIRADLDAFRGDRILKDDLTLVVLRAR
jgi:serine phosphatase RsbU (regulator of sigma subunit)